MTFLILCQWSHLFFCFWNCHGLIILRIAWLGGTVGVWEVRSQGVIIGAGCATTIKVKHFFQSTLPGRLHHVRVMSLKYHNFLEMFVITIFVVVFVLYLINLVDFLSFWDPPGGEDHFGFTVRRHRLGVGITAVVDGTCNPRKHTFTTRQPVKHIFLVNHKTPISILFATFNNLRLQIHIVLVHVGYQKWHRVIVWKDDVVQG